MEDRVTGMEKNYTRLDWLTFFVILVILAISVLSLMNIIQIETVIGTAIAAIALILYFRDRWIVEPVILQTFVDIIPKDNEYLKVNKYIILAFISNEGARKADDCEVVVAIGGVNDIKLDYVPIDSQEIGVDWPQKKTYKTYTLYPRRPIWVRGYVTAEPNTQIDIVLRWKEYSLLTKIANVLRGKDKEYRLPTFSLP